MKLNNKEYKLQWLPEYNLWGLRYFPDDCPRGYMGVVTNTLTWTEEELIKILLENAEIKA